MAIFVVAFVVFAGTVVAVSLGSWRIALILLALIQVAILVIAVDSRATLARSEALARIAPKLARSERKLDEIERKLDEMSHRSTAGLESDRLDAPERERALLERSELHGSQAQIRDQLVGLDSRVGSLASLVEGSKLPEQLGQLDGDLKRLEKRFDLVATRNGSIKDIEAVAQLFARINQRAAMPSSGGWALDPVALLALLELIERHRPELVVELGSGTSSIWIGYLLEQLGGGRLVSVESEPEFAERTRAAVEAHSLSDVVDILVAPLEEIDLPGHDARWYSTAVFEELDGIDLLLVDGPPGGTGHHARYPALPVLRSALAPSALVVLDDVGRADEREIVQRWLESAPEMESIPPLPDALIAVLRMPG